MNLTELIKIDPEEVIDVITDWLYDNSISDNEAPEDEFFVEEFDHGAFIRWGSKKGDFPRLASGGLFPNKYHIITSGELVDEKIVISDDNAKIPFDIEQLVWKFLLETQMKDCDKGYEIPEVKTPNGDIFKIKVEKINP